MHAWVRTVGLGVLVVLLAGFAFRATDSDPLSTPATIRPSGSGADGDEPGAASGETAVSVGPIAGLAGRAIYVSSADGGSIDGVPFAAQDLLVLDVERDRWSIYLDGSDIGLADSTSIDGFHVKPSGAVLFSLSATAELPGVGEVDGSDVVEFTPSSVGAETSGTLWRYFDGSEHDLIGPGANVDVVALDAHGRLLLSTVAGVDLGFGPVAAEDVMVFDGRALSRFLDGSAAGLGAPGEDVAGLSVDPTGVIHLLTVGDHRVTGATGGPADVLQCVPTTPAPISGCAWSTYRAGSGGQWPSATVTGLTVTGAVNYFNEFNDFTDGLGPEWVIYDSIGHAGWGLRRPSAVEIVRDPSVAGGGRLTITARMGSGPEAGRLVSGGLKLLAPQTYGRYTVRLKADPDPDEVTSMVALLWPESNEWPRDGEIDIVETWRARATRLPVESTLHWLEPGAIEPFDSADDEQSGEVHPGVSGAEWHTYTLEWRPDLISVSVDGAPPVVLSRDRAEIADWNMEPTLQLDAFDSPDAQGQQPVLSAPVTMSVDWLLVQP